MSGTAVFRWAAHSLEKVCREALDSAGVSTDEDIDALMPHQANGRITDVMARVLKLPEKLRGRGRHRGDRQHVRPPRCRSRWRQMLRKGEAKPGDTALLHRASAPDCPTPRQVVTLPKLEG